VSLPEIVNAIRLSPRSGSATNAGAVDG
jgi:hypothetical protein